MSAEVELVEALRIIRQENVRLQDDNARLRQLIAVLPDRHERLVEVLAEIRGLLWSLVQQDGASSRRGRDSGQMSGEDEGFGLDGGIPPAPDVARWPGWHEEPAREGAGAPSERTQVEIPQEPDWTVPPSA